MLQQNSLHLAFGEKPEYEPPYAETKHAEEKKRGYRLKHDCEHPRFHGAIYTS